MKKLVIIDGYSLLFRAYYATAYKGPENILKTSNGTPINAIVTFAYMVFHILQNLGKDDGICVALDTGHKTKRHEEFPQYKANRAAVPQYLIDQMPILREFLDSLNISRYEEIGYEADDVAGSLAKEAEKEGINVEIYTSDKDYLQLVGPKITVNLIKKGIKDTIPSTTSNFKELYKFNPEQLIDYKGLRGDSSDNLPGVSGIGEITAIDLLEKYNNIDGIYENIESITGKLKEKLVAGKDIAYLCRELATINTALAFPFEINSLTYKGYKFVDAQEFIKKYELKSFVTRLSKIKEFQTEVQESLFDFEDESAEIELKNLEILENCRDIAISLDYKYDNYHKTDWNGFGFFANNQSYYISKENALKCKVFKALMEDEKVNKYFYEYKPIRYILLKNGINISLPTFDLTLAIYMIDSNIKCDVVSAFRYFDKDIIEYDSNNKLHTLLVAKYLFNIKDKVLNLLEQKQLLNLFKEIELPLSRVLCDMEFEGFPVSKNVLNEFKTEYEQRIKVLEDKIHEMSGNYEFNIASTQQLAPVLAEVLNIDKSKIKSTSVDFLKHYDDHPFVQLILEYRKYKKLLSTYVEGISSEIYEDGKLHCIFNQNLTSTGRLSCSEPNLQNITVRDEEGKLIRKAFFYESDDYYILSYDYSQIELRVLAHISNCEQLINAFNSGEDIHSATAKIIFDTNEVTSAQRRKAKTVNFGIVYGMSDFGLAEELGIDFKEARNIISSFYNSFPAIKEYQERTIKDLEKYKYVKTLFNRIRYIPEIDDANYRVREFAKRAGINVPIQGSAADLIKIAMIKIYDLLKNCKSKMISQIHDELIFKVHKDEINELAPKIKDIMEHVISLKVPLLVEGDYAKDWYSVK